MRPVATLLSLLLSGVSLLLFAYVILSWMETFRHVSRSVPYIDPGNPLVRFIDRTAYAILHPIRRVIGPYQRNFPLDLSILVAFLLIMVIRSTIIPLIPF